MSGTGSSILPALYMVVVAVAIVSVIGIHAATTAAPILAEIAAQR